MLMCASKMLRHVNLQHYSESIRTAIREVLAAGKVSNVKYSIRSFNLKCNYCINYINFNFNHILIKSLKTILTIFR